MEPLNAVFAPESESLGCYGTDETTLKCPVCGYDYNHVAEPVIQPTDDYDFWAGRGTLVSLPFWCENGHKYLLCFGFHKGNITTFWKRLPNQPTPKLIDGRE